MKSMGRVNLIRYTSFALILLLVLGLAGCNAFAGSTPAPLPTVVLDNNGTAEQSTPFAQGGGVTASGKVVPAQEVQLSFALAGQVKISSLAVGDQVQAGQVLASLAGDEKLAAAVAGANLELLTAQQALDALSKDMDVQQAQAWEAYLQARKVYSDTLQAHDNLNSLPNSPSAQAARTVLENAQALVRQLKAYYNSLPGSPDTNPDKAKALMQLKMARFRQEIAQKQVDLYGGEPSSEELQRSDADLAMAKARMAKSQRDFETLQKGPDPQQVELAQARLDTAKAQLAAAQSSVDDLDLRAPFDGTITQLHIHTSEWVNPGQAVLLLGDLQNLHVETTDLSERDIPNVEIGKPVQVIVKALNGTITGRVTAIAPLADTLGGDVVYKTTIQLDSLLPGLRAGMSVEVQF